MAKAKRQLIDKNMEKFIYNNFDKKDRKKDISLQFEWFVNSMHIWHCSSTLFNADTKIGKKMTLGNSEGCDAFFISINNQEKIFSLSDNLENIIAYLKEFGRSITFHFIQSKKTNSIEWINYLNLFEIPLKIWKGLEFDKSQKHLKRVQDFIDVVTNEEDTELKKIEHKIEIVFYTTYDNTHIAELEKYWKTNIEAKITELSNWFTKDNIKVQIKGSEFLNDIYEKINSNEYELFVNKGNVISIDSEKYLIGYITAKELLDSIAPSINGERILYLDVFKNNIRLYLGNETVVNKNIEKTLKEEPEKFHFYNNGLTITTKSISSENSKTFTIKPVNIVNGCQTANSIYNVFCSEKKFPENDVKIPVRIIVAQDTEFENITIRTNTQNGLDTKDLISINSIQKEIEYEFSQKLFLGKKFYYKRQKSNEEISDEIDYIIQIDDILRSVFSTLMLIPNKVSGFFDKTTSKYIDQIFDENFIKLYTILTVLYKSVEDYIENNHNTHNRLKFHICYLIYKFANKNKDLSSIEEFLRSKDKEDYSDEKIEEIKLLINTIYLNICKSIESEMVFSNVVEYIMNKIKNNYPMLLDLSTKEKERELYRAVEKLPRIRVSPIFSNFSNIFTEDYNLVIGN